MTTTRALEQMVYHAVMEFAPWPMAEVEGGAHVLQACNPAFCALVGRSQEELLGRPIAQLFAQGHATHGLLDRVQLSGEAAIHVETARNTPGPIYWSYTCWPVQARDSRHVGLMIQVTETDKADQRTKDMNEALLISSVQQHELTAVAEDLNVKLQDEMNERRKAQDAVRVGDERLRFALEAAELGTWSMDTITRRFSVDARYQEIMGVTRVDLSLEQGMASVHPDDLDRVTADVREVMEKGIDSAVEIEYRVLHPDGSIHWVLTKGRALFAHAGEAPTLAGFAGTVADITARKHMQLTLEQTAKDLAEVDRRKSEFLATLAHELRNPLAPLRNGLELLAMAEHDRATWDQAHGMMVRQLDQMVRLIDELMDLSRISRGVVDLRLEQGDLRTAMDNAVEACRPLMASQHHTLLVAMPDVPVMIEGDSMRLTQIFGNLLNNAAKYTDKGGTISVQMDTDGTDARVTVVDNGIGIAKDQLDKVFDMFAQVERTSDRVQGGLGIGLNIVKHLVGMHGGSIVASSAGLAKGSSFSIRLPLASAPAKSMVTAAPVAAIPGSILPKRILIVDDNVDAAFMMALLMRANGHELRIAHNGEEALSIGSTFNADVVLMDLGMPVMNGFAACRRMRNTPWGAKALIVALSGWGQDEDRARTKEAGFDHHLVKPVGMEVLMGVIATRN